MITYAPDVSTLMRPATMIKLSNPPHSKHSITAVGIPIFRYSLKSLNVSLVKKKKESLRSVEAMQNNVIRKKFNVYDISIARDAPYTPSYAILTRR